MNSGAHSSGTGFSLGGDGGVSRHGTIRDTEIWGDRGSSAGTLGVWERLNIPLNSVTDRCMTRARPLLLNS